MALSNSRRLFQRFLILLTLLVPACTSAPVEKTAVLSLTQEGLGVVTVNGVERALPWTGTFQVDSQILIGAQPGVGYEFAGWSGDLSSTGNPASFQLRGDMTIKASFVAVPTISVSPASRDFGPVLLGESQELNFTVENPGAGFLVGAASVFAPFSIVGGSTYTIGTEETHLVRVRFSPTEVGAVTGTVSFTGGGGHTVAVTGVGVEEPPAQVGLDVSVTGSGSVFSDPPGIACPGSCSGTFRQGSNVVLTGVPDPTSQDARWTGCDSPSDGGTAVSCVIAMNTDRAVSATFSAAPVVGISISPTGATLFTGESRSFTAAITGTSDTRVTWTTSGGHFAGTGTTITYSAPDSAGSYTVTATSVADPTKSASANVIVDARRVVQLAAGGAHSLALKNDGTVWAWGDNSLGQLGNGTTANHYSPTQVPGLTNITRIAAGGNHSLAIRADGVLLAWGSNDYGQLGIDSPDLNSLVPVAPNISGWVTEISAGTAHSVALTDDGTVWTWGDNSYAQLGDGTPNDRSRPGALLAPEAVIAIAAGENHTLAVDQQGAVYAWGQNMYAQIGNWDNDAACPVTPGGQEICVWTPKVVISGSGRSVSAGSKFSFALTNNGTILGWGQNVYGQLAAESSRFCRPVSGALVSHPCSETPLRVDNLPSVRLVRLGARHVLAVTTEGHLYSWGLNTSGQLGVESVDFCAENPLTDVVCNKAPVQVSTLEGVLTVAAGTSHSVAVLTDGTVWAWGGNGTGQLGIGTVTPQSRPVLVSMP